MSWKFWVGENLNVINPWGEPQKRWDQVHWGKAKGRGGHDFWLKFSWGDLEKIMSFHRALDFIFIFCTHFAPFFHYDFLFINSFSFIINNIFFPRKEKVESSLEILLYDFSISMQNTYDMNEEQRWLQTFFSNLILCTERTSYARDVSNEWIYLLY